MILESIKAADIAIDEMTPCLMRRSDGATIDTTIKTITPRNTDLTYFSFDWDAAQKEGYTILALTANGDPRVQGLIAIMDKANEQAVFVGLVESAAFNIGGDGEFSGVGAHLFAEAAKRSMDLGYNGFVAFDSKTALVEHYKRTLGAVQVGSSQRMTINEIAAKRLIERYYGK